MHYVLIIHKVEDYADWKTIFDNTARIRTEAREVSYQVLKFETGINNIVHFSRCNSLPSAKNFFESERLVEIHKQAGVKAPRFIYLDELEQGVLK